MSTMASEELSPIQEFYKDTTVFITGGTGFMGKILIEKLLRSCPKISRIILLVRPKKGQNAEHRLTAMFDDVVFDRIDEKSRLKVSVVDGDCVKPDLGLSEADRQDIIENVNVIFHAAATVRFNEELSLAVAINIVGTKAMVDLAKEAKRLKAFVHVSTAFSNCHLEEIKEKFYPPHISSNDIINIVGALDRPSLEHLTPFLLKDVPNSYVYTKSVAEDYVRTHSKGLPLAVFRPSIIISTKDEPLPGWIDNVYGPTGVVVGSATGILRSMYCKPTAVADLVPMDMAVNALITTAYKINSGINNNLSEEPIIFNFVSSPDSPIQWKTFFQYCKKYVVPSIHAVWYPKVSLHSSLFIHKLDRIWKHLLPAMIVDFIAKLAFKKTNMLKMSWKIENFIELLSFFSTHQWRFHNDNTVALWESLDPKDKQIFPFSFKDHDWDLYFKSYMLGARLYLMKDDLKTREKALKWNSKLLWMNTVLEGMVYLLLFGGIFKFAGQPIIRFVYNYFLDSTYR